MDISHRKLLDDFNRAFNEHDVEAMLALMTEDCVFENTFPGPLGTRYVGAAAVRSFWMAFFTASPAARIEIEDSFGEGERLCQRWIYRWGEGENEFVRGVDILHLRAGKISHKLSYVKG